MDARTKASILAVISVSRMSLCFSDPTPEAPSAADVQALLRANGAADLAAQGGPIAAQQISVNLHRVYPNLPNRADAVVLDVVVTYLREQADQDRVVEKLVPIYSKYLNKEEIQQLTAFYRSAVGRKLVSVTPAISLESAKLGQDWMESILPGLQTKLVNRLRAEKLID
jgi:hypothetical protein